MVSVQVKLKTQWSGNTYRYTMYEMAPCWRKDTLCPLRKKRLEHRPARCHFILSKGVIWK